MEEEMEINQIGEDSITIARLIKYSANENILRQRAIYDINYELADKMIIGIDEANRCNLFGSIIISLVMIPIDFSKTFRLGIKDSKLLTRKKRDYIFNELKGKIYWQVRRIEPYMMEENINDLEMKMAVDMLNTVPRFWNHRININNWEIDKEHFIDRFDKVSPINLKNLNLNLKKKNWNLFHGNCRDKASQLAGIFARMHWDKDLDELKNMYGIIGSGSPSDKKTIGFIKENISELPPFVRKTYEPVKSLLKENK